MEVAAGIDVNSGSRPVFVDAAFASGALARTGAAIRRIILHQRAIGLAKQAMHHIVAVKKIALGLTLTVDSGCDIPACWSSGSIEGCERTVRCANIAVIAA